MEDLPSLLSDEFGEASVEIKVVNASLQAVASETREGAEAMFVTFATFPEDTVRKLARAFYCTVPARRYLLLARAVRPPASRTWSRPTCLLPHFRSALDDRSCPSPR